MLILQQAIDLATKAHEGQFRKPELLPKRMYNEVNLQLDAKQKKKPSFSFIFGDLLILDNGARCYKGDHGTLIELPYITHPLAVMDMMSTDEEKIVAVLHDVIENTESEFVYNLAPIGCFLNGIKLPTIHIGNALQLLTHDKTLTYQEYISKIVYSKNKLAIKVKIADIVHNLSCSPSEYAKEKYLKAIPILLASI